MQIFPLIEKVLDELYAQIPGDSAAKDQKVNKALAMLSQRYSDLASTAAPVEYSRPATRFAYIYKYVTCHSNLVYRQIECSQHLPALFDQKAVRVACLGGGPGSDFLGVLKYCTNSGKTPDLKCLLFDREIGWGESWEDVDDKISDEATISTRTVYQPLDVTEPASYEAKVKYLKQSDLFTMIYFASEIYALRDDGGDDYLDHVFSGMHTGAYVLYIDNNHSIFTNWIEQKFKSHALKVLEAGEGVHKMPIEEEKKDLGKYYQRFDSAPKLEADVACRIAQKS